MAENYSADIINELTLLYELAMSSSSTNELEQVCSNFIDILKNRKNLTTAGIWIKDDPYADTDMDELRLIKGLPLVLFKQTVLSKDNALLQLMTNSSVYSSELNDTLNFHEFPHKNGLSIFTAAISIGNIGILTMTAERKENPFTDLFLNKLYSVVQKLGTSIEGSIAYGAILNEMDQRDKAEKELLKSKEQLKYAFDGSNEGLWDWNIDTGDVFFSDRWLQMIGYDRNDIRPHVDSWSTLIHPEDESHTMVALKKCLNGETEWYKCEHRLKTSDGTYKWILDRGKIVERTESGSPKRMVGTHQDISERKALENELHILNSELEKRVEEKSKQLHQTQLNMMHQEKLASIGQLAAGVAHELNNPIGFISSNFEVLNQYINKIKKYFSYHDDFLKAHLNPELVAKLLTIKKQHKIDFILNDIEDIFSESDEGFHRITKIVNSLRSFSRIDNDDEREVTNLNDGITSTLVVAANEYRYVADVIENLKSIPDIKCNAGAINQVLLNIIVNAAQAIGEQKRNGKGKITISTWSDHQNVFCTIEDDGPGIPQEHISSIFDPFFTTKPPGTGTGLGLNIAYDIINNKHNGSISVENTGNGTKFLIRLPIQQDKEA